MGSIFIDTATFKEKRRQKRCFWNPGNIDERRFVCAINMTIDGILKDLTRHIHRWFIKDTIQMEIWPNSGVQSIVEIDSRFVNVHHHSTILIRKKIRSGFALWTLAKVRMMDGRLFWGVKGFYLQMIMIKWGFVLQYELGCDCVVQVLLYCKFIGCLSTRWHAIRSLKEKLFSLEDQGSNCFDFKIKKKIQ
jgi:hypothetical protein